MLQPNTIRRVVLTGFMGAGKSTVGALLAEALGWRFLDSDAEIERRCGLTIAQIFEQQGEAAFRALEVVTIGECAHEEGVILALGGGAIESASTRELLANLDQTRVIFLDAPLEVMIARCLGQPGAAERPVLASTQQLPLRLAARLPWYRQAHWTVATEDATPDELVAQILNRLQGESVIAEGSTTIAEVPLESGKGTVIR
jgi:shikimate kinase